MKPRCAGCKKRITRGEPDLILRRMDPDNPMRTALKLVYHVATEKGIRSVADSYLEGRPQAKRRWEEFVAANQEASQSSSFEGLLGRGLMERAFSSEAEAAG
jgi:hypothetical protein